MDDFDNNTYKTSNTALAAYLLSEGFGRPELEQPDNYNRRQDNGNRRYFIFPFNTENPKLKKCVTAWETGQAKGNCNIFFNAYQSLLRRIKENY